MLTLIFQYRFLAVVFIFLYPAQFNAQENDASKYTWDWVVEDNISLDDLFEMAKVGDVDEKYEIYQLLTFGSTLFDNEDIGKVHAIINAIAHSAALLGHPKAQWGLSVDYQSGLNGFPENKRVAEFWRKKAIENGVEFKGMKIEGSVSEVDFKNQQILLCSVDLQTVTGIQETRVTNPDLNFALVKEYDDILFVNPDSDRVERFQCSLTLSSTNVTLFSDYCFASDKETFETIQLSQFHADYSTLGKKDEYQVAWTLGLADLITLRQGTCKKQKR